jgi:hypothetical protein
MYSQSAPNLIFYKCDLYAYVEFTKITESNSSPELAELADRGDRYLDMTEVVPEVKTTHVGINLNFPFASFSITIHTIC